MQKKGNNPKERKAVSCKANPKLKTTQAREDSLILQAQTAGTTNGESQADLGNRTRKEVSLIIEVHQMQSSSGRGSIQGIPQKQKLGAEGIHWLTAAQRRVLNGHGNLLLNNGTGGNKDSSTGKPLKPEGIRIRNES